MILVKCDSKLQPSSSFLIRFGFLRFSIASRSATGPSCGKRIVAGRIVKESYGAAKQQHTFTVRINLDSFLWWILKLWQSMFLLHKGTG